MPLKTPVTTSGQSTLRRDNNINMVNDDTTQDLQLVIIKVLKNIVDQINNNQLALDNKINGIGLLKVKLPSIKWFDGTRLKLKGFLLQMRFKVMQEKDKMGILMDQVMYTKLFLMGRALKWFEPYLMEIQTNGITTLNQEVRYMFSS